MKSVLVAWLLLSSFNASAFWNLGELLDAGGVLLGKEELTKVISDTSWSMEPNLFEITYKSDGTFTGYARGDERSGSGRGVFGTWTIDDKGLFCFKHLARGASSSQPFCRYWFRLGDRYFGSTDSADRAAPVGPRIPKQ